MSDQTEDYGYAADALYAELRRAWPEELTQQELLSSCGLDTEEARAGLDLLRRQGRLDDSAGQYKAMVEEETVPVAREGEGDLEDDDVHEEPTVETPAPSTLSVAPGTTTCHSHFVVMVAFSQANGTSAEATVKTAKAMEAEIADDLLRLYGGAVINVELDRIDVSKPQTIYEGGTIADA